LSECYRELGKEKELEKFLLSSLEENPSITAAISVADLLYGAPGMEARAHDFIAGQLLKRPSLKGVQRLIELLAAQATSEEKGPLQDLRKLTGQLLESKPVYQCTHCGYAGKYLAWQCPGCSQWGKIKPIYGIEGE
jgi:lipopolysaccharide biosynthesis regulator YciM